MPAKKNQRPYREGDLQICTGTCGRVTRPNGVLMDTCPPNTVIRNGKGKCWVCADPRGRSGVRPGRPRREQTEEAKAAMLAKQEAPSTLEVDETNLTEKERYVLAGARAFTNARRERLARLRRRVNA